MPMFGFSEYMQLFQHNLYGINYRLWLPLADYYISLIWAAARPLVETLQIIAIQLFIAHARNFQLFNYNSAFITINN